MSQAQFQHWHHPLSTIHYLNKIHVELKAEPIECRMHGNYYGILACASDKVNTYAHVHGWIAWTLLIWFEHGLFFSFYNSFSSPQNKNDHQTDTLLCSQTLKIKMQTVSSQVWRRAKQNTRRQDTQQEIKCIETFLKRFASNAMQMYVVDWLWMNIEEWICCGSAQLTKKMTHFSLVEILDGWIMQSFINDYVVMMMRSVKKIR